jgi:predicted ester cyclase
MSIGPTGRQVQIAGIWIHQIAGEKIVESWNVWDTLGMLQQLGVVAHLQRAL